MKKAKTGKPENLPGLPFPFALPSLTPRPVQLDALTAIHAAFESGKRFVIFEGPPGVGKTLCAASLARHYGSAYVCTVTKQLQEQWVRDFEPIGARTLKGRASFPCVRAGGTCELGAVLFRGRDACGMGGRTGGARVSCPYRVAKAEALGSNLLVANYFSFLWNVPYGEDGEGEEGIGGARDLAVFDEAHEIERVLMDHVSVEIRTDKLPIEFAEPLPVLPGNLNLLKAAPYFDWLAKLSDALAKELAAHGTSHHMDAEKVVAAERLLNSIGYATHYKDSEEWIVELRDEKDRDRGFSLKPLTIASFCNQLFRFGERVLLMSATILDAKKMAEYWGLKWDEVAFVQAPCVFPKENRAIVNGNLPMTYKHRDESWPAMIPLIERVLDYHKNEKGLLLAQSNEMLKFIVQRLSRSHSSRLILAYGSEREAKLKMHIGTASPTVLAASGYWEGLDLSGDLSRFQIIPSIPRPMWKGQIEARARLDPDWYRLQTFTKFIQGVGRSVRCFDYATEILTTEGWKSVHTLKIGDRAYGVPRSKFDAQRPFRWGRLAIVENPVLGVSKMEHPEATLRIRTSSVDLVVTPDHRMVYQPVKVSNYVYGRTTPSGNPWQQKIRYRRRASGLEVSPARELPARFNLPCAGWVTGRSCTGHSRDWFWLAGFIIGDGNLSKTKNEVTIYQSTASSQREHVDRLNSTLKRLGLSFRYSETTEPGECFGYTRNGCMGSWVLSGYDSARVRDFFYSGQRRRYSKTRKYRQRTHRGVDGWKTPEKRIPRWILQRATPMQMLTLLEGMMAADGTTRGESRRSPIHVNGTYWTSDPVLADQVQELLALCGFRSVIAERHRGNRKTQLGVSFSNPATSDVTRETCIRAGPTTNVWCPSTELGTVLARRGGHTFIAGNSETDHAVTYVFDADLRREATRARGSMIPAWLKEAIEYSG